MWLSREIYNSMVRKIDSLNEVVSTLRSAQSKSENTKMFTVIHRDGVRKIEGESFAPDLSGEFIVFDDYADKEVYRISKNLVNSIKTEPNPNNGR